MYNNIKWYKKVKHKQTSNGKIYMQQSNGKKDETMLES